VPSRGGLPWIPAFFFNIFFWNAASLSGEMELGPGKEQDTVAGAQCTQSVDNDAATPSAIWTVKTGRKELRAKRAES